MARTPQDVTETELAVLQVLWDSGPATIRQLTDVLYPGGGTAQYSTVQKMLERLENKDCVRRERTPPAHVFSAAIAREDLIDRRLRDVAEKLCGGSLTPLLTHLVRTRALTMRERQELRDLIDELDPKDKGKKRPR
ncbi:MAG TPA: BlaI/MecI/CopY family transcriptional regulator [Gemmataceae bacterium]|nr:BlaI/MecI/CopY family transcriptional regulator [Gemmataceae bacterium]